MPVVAYVVQVGIDVTQPDCHRGRVPAAETGLPRDSKAQAEQVRAVSVDRVAERIGTVPAELMLKVDEALRLHFGL